MDSLISVFATVSEWIFVLDLHREPRRVRIGLTFDLGKRPPLPNDRLFGIILGDPRQRKLQFSRTDYQQDNHYPRNDLVSNVGQQLSNWQTIFPFCRQSFLVRTIRALAARAGLGCAFEGVHRSEVVDWNLIDYPVLFLQPIVAMEEVMPRAIKREETTEHYVALVLTAAICLILIVVAMELPTGFILP